MSGSLVELVKDALARRPAAVQQLIDQLYPVVQARVARVLWRSRGSASRDVKKQDVEDMCQDVFAELFEDGGKALRAWDPQRGLSLQNFVGLLAERHAISVLRSGRRSPFTEDPTLDSTLDRQSEPVASPEPAALSRDLLSALLDRLRLAVSPLGMHLFELLYVEERSVEEVARVAAMSNDAVYAWRSRLRKLVVSLAAELGQTTPLPVPVTKEAQSHE